MSVAVIPGSFDPVTFGHLDIIERAARQFDHVLVAAVANPSKANASVAGTLFGADDRRTMLTEVTAHIPEVTVEVFGGLLADFAISRGAGAIVKGLRAVSDFDYELQMAQLNYRLSGVETFFMPTAPEHSFLSSSLVREVASHGGEVSSMVPPEVARRLKERFAP